MTMSLDDQFEEMISDLSPEHQIDDRSKRNLLKYKRVVKFRNHSTANRLASSRNSVFLRRSLRTVLNKMRSKRHCCGGALFLFDDHLENEDVYELTPHEKLKRKRIPLASKIKLINVSINSDIKLKTSDLMGSYFNGKRRQSARIKRFV